MKNTLTKIFLAAAVFLITAATTTAQTSSRMYVANDSLKTVTTKYLTYTVGSPGAYYVQFAFVRITDTVNAIAYLEASTDNVDFVTYPGTDSVIVTSATLGDGTSKKLWYLQPATSTAYLPKYLRIRVKSSKANGAAIIRANVYK